MKKSELNTILRKYVKQNLSPKEREREFISEIYHEVQAALGENSCRQIGSYPRRTSITPVEDLDVLYFAGNQDDFVDQPMELLNDLGKVLDEHFSQTSYQYEIDPPQTHSICINFPELKFSVDIVPAYEWGTNDFGDPVFQVPEIIKVGHRKRARVYEEKMLSRQDVGWVLSDPLGYISVAQQLNENNSDFRKAVKLVKRWKFGCKDVDEDFKLKSFHIEQIITSYFIEDESLEIFDAVFKFFVGLPEMVKQAQILDRADSSIMIDEYVNNLTDEERENINSARDTFLIHLEELADESDVPELLNPERFYLRADSEEFIFDEGIPVLTEDEYGIKIDGKVTNEIVDAKGTVHKKTASEYWLSDKSGKVATFRRIKFQIVGKYTELPLYRWKVKNDDGLEMQKRRGEITDGKTANFPEHTAFIGNHYVKCYGILDGICVAKSKINVHIPE